jgi:hypothetical protein
MILFEKEERALSLEEFEKLVGAKWICRTDFGAFKPKKEKPDVEELWLGSYYKKELQNGAEPDVTIRWIDPLVGWGVFTNRPFKKMEYIAEYVGKVRKRRRSDSKNGYCFEYASKYNIDAMEEGGLSRYINHSSKPNLNSSLAWKDGIGHIILYTKEPVAKGVQLCYDYGPDYWAKRPAPREL